MEGRVRLAELLGSLSFAGDLGRGQPMGHVLRTTRLAMMLASRLAVPSAQMVDVYFCSLLVHAGCTAGASDCAAFLAGDELSAQKDACLCDPSNMGQMFRWMTRNVAPGRPLTARALRMMQLMSKGDRCFEDVSQGCSEVGSRIAQRLGMSESTQLALYHICETANGKGPHRLKGEDIPLVGRIVNVAMILEVFLTERGAAAAKEAAIARRGKSFDRTVASAAIELCGDAELLSGLQDAEPWASVLDLEPGPVRYVDDGALDDFSFALADIVDLKSDATLRHSRQTAEVAGAIAARLRLNDDETALLRRAALVHDVGLVAVPSFLLAHGNSWSEADVERFRLHTYYTERILARSEFLRPIGVVASAHHENIDGSGYHRGLTGSQMSLPGRILATVSRYQEALETSEVTDPEFALGVISKLPLDGDCLAALAAEVGGKPSEVSARKSWPAGLTDREVEVLRLVGSGLNLKEAAGRLVISDHTVRHHVESIYGKINVSSRAGATLFAVENGLLG